MFKKLPFILTIILITSGSVMAFSEHVNFFKPNKTFSGIAAEVGGLTETAADTAKADYKFNYANVSHAGLVSGQQFTLNYSVLNAGSIAQQSARVTVLFSADTIVDQLDKVVYTGTNLLLGAGTSQPNSVGTHLDSNIPFGIYYILYVIDIENNLTESNKKNNFRYVKISIGEPFDVGFWESAYYSYVEAGQQIVFTVKANNEGTVTAPKTTTRFYLSDDVYLDSKDILLPDVFELQTIQPGAIVTENYFVNVPDTLKPGEHFLICSLDDGNKVHEFNEMNNLREFRFEVVLAEGMSENEPEVSDFQIYPNPSTGVINVTGYKSTREGEFRSSLLDARGNLISENVLRTLPGKIDLSEYSEGVYFLKIMSDNATSMIKIFRH
jgi:hypothetical protein